jgi:hypothetical protein
MWPSPEPASCTATYEPTPPMPTTRAVRVASSSNARSGRSFCSCAKTRRLSRLRRSVRADRRQRMRQPHQPAKPVECTQSRPIGPIVVRYAETAIVALAVDRRQLPDLCSFACSHWVCAATFVRPSVWRPSCSPSFSRPFYVSLRPFGSPIVEGLRTALILPHARVSMSTMSTNQMTHLRAGNRLDGPTIGHAIEESVVRITHNASARISTTSPADNPSNSRSHQVHPR